MFTLFDSISHNYSYAKLHLTFYCCYAILELIKGILPKRINKWKITQLTKKFQLR